ncbi:MAG: VOC family protein [Micromonosporaceae bacterium]
MTSSIRHITIDCTGDAYDLALFWCQVLGRRVHDDDKPGDTEVLIPGDSEEHQLLFIQVRDTKTVKNRVHLDLAPADRTRDAEVERLLGLGAKLVADHRVPDGRGWVVLADPDGNEFCVERGEADRTAG